MLFLPPPPLHQVLVRAFDFHGQPQRTGTDPICVRFTDPQGREAPSHLVDREDGTYEVTLLPLSPGHHTLSVDILSRAIQGSPYNIPVRGRQRPQWSINAGTLRTVKTSTSGFSRLPSGVFFTPNPQTHTRAWLTAFVESNPFLPCHTVRGHRVQNVHPIL